MALRSFVRRATTKNGTASRRQTRLRVELLEDRCLLAGNPFSAISYTPAQIRKAYGFDQLANTGLGATIAIVDAYHAPNLQSDLAKFDSKFLGDISGATPFLTVLDQNGGTNYPNYNSGWSQEITLDVEWAHAIAPSANILLVEAASNSFGDLFTAVDYAAHYSNVGVVSMSWGSNEFSGETAYDAHFMGVSGVTFVASAGDTGAVTSYPAVSPYVVGVGGTSLKVLNATGAYGSETAWSSSGGGVSAYESKPTYQSGLSYAMRSSPDVAYNADPNTGVAVIWNGNQYTFGGTSIGAPQWAGLVAIADSMHGTPLDTASVLSALYGAAGTDFHDITSGTAGSKRNGNNAGKGYDLVTGLGSPVANNLVPHLAGVAGAAIVAGGSTSGTGGSAGAHAENSDVIGNLGGAPRGVTIVGPVQAPQGSKPPAIHATPNAQALSVQALNLTLLSASRLQTGATMMPIFAPVPRTLPAAPASALVAVSVATQSIPPSALGGGGAAAYAEAMQIKEPAQERDAIQDAQVLAETDAEETASQEEAPTTAPNAMWAAAALAYFAHIAPLRENEEKRRLASRRSVGLSQHERGWRGDD